MLSVAKHDSATSLWSPFETGSVRTRLSAARRLRVCDGAGRVYVDAPLRAGRSVGFAARGTAGRHTAEVLDDAGRPLEQAAFTLQARTVIRCDQGPYGRLAERIEQLLALNDERAPLLINGRLYRMLVTWGRDHVHTLKAAKYFMDDVRSGLEYWLQTQEPSGMLWDCIHPNGEFPGRSWFGEALGKGYFRYDDGGRFIVRRIPVEADCEFLYAEGVWGAWKATGDDAWMAAQLPCLDRALAYNSSHPTRWSRRHGLVKRSMCMDSWDFVNPHFCSGDHRCINPGDEQFLFHGDNSGLYSFYRRLAEMHAHCGHARRAAELRRQGEALRQRANAKLFFGTHYGHMIPEDTRRAATIYRQVGDERERMSLSTGYTLNRGLPTHEMAVKTLDEYRRRGRRLRKSSFAEWWSMDPMYTHAQWPMHGTGGSTEGEYMNGSICPIVAGELAKAAFDHGREDYGVDILDRLWALSERDGGRLHQTYRRLPEKPAFPKARFRFADLRGVANRGLRNGARRGVVAWTGEGDNDLRGLPVGKQRFGAIAFDVIDPARNRGLAVVSLNADPEKGTPRVEIPVARLTGRSLYFLHTQARSTPAHTPIGRYTVRYADGSESALWVRNGDEIGHWWGVSDAPDWRNRALVNRATTRVAWRGANPTWANVGIHMFGWNNPHPEKPVVAVVAEALAAGRGGGIMLAGVSFSNQPVGFEPRIRSHGLPDCWSQAAVFYGIAEGLAGIEDAGTAFSVARVSPRWTATAAREAEAVLHYPASGGYCATRFRHDPRRRTLEFDVTGSFTTADVRCLLPKGVRRLAAATLAGRPLPHFIERVERSHYAVIHLDALPTEPIRLKY